MPRTVSIRTSLLTNLVVVVVLLAATILALVAYQGQRAVGRFSHSLIDQTIGRTELELAGFFEPVERQLHVLRRSLDTEALDAGDPAALYRSFESIMREIPWIAGCILADERGRGRLLRRTDDGWAAAAYAEDGWDDRIVGFGPGVDEQDPAQGREEGFDPRIRPWYLGATEKLESAAEGADSEIHWTEPYMFFNRKLPGITAAMAFRSAAERTTVLGCDVLLLDISRFTTGIRVLENGAAFVLTSDSRVIGLPRSPRFSDEQSFTPFLLKRADEMGTTAAAEASRSLLGPESLGRVSRFEGDAGAMWGQVKPYDLASDRRVLMGVAVPEADLLGDLQRQRIWIAGIALAVLALAVGRAILLATRYSRPIEALVAESARISQGDLDPPEAIDSRVREVHRLAEAHDKMRVGLRQLLKIERDLQLARRIQQKTFPGKLPTLEGIDLAAWSEPAEETGGDTYDVIGLRGASPADQIVLTDEQAGRAVLLLADATGHGIGPALSVTQIRAMLRIAVRMSTDLVEIVTQINEQLCADLPAGRFITAWLGSIDTSDYTLRSIAAGQGPILRYEAAADTFHVNAADATPLGLFEPIKLAPPQPIRLAPGDIVAVISDGIFEAGDPDGEQFESDRVVETIRAHRDRSAGEILDAIREAVDRFARGHAPDDDRTMILIKRA